VPVLGGHHGGNQIARVLAGHLGGHAAVTTAGDVRFGVSLDEPPAGWQLTNPQNAKAVMAALLGGAHVRAAGDQLEMATWLTNSELPFSPTGDVRLTVGNREDGGEPAPLELVYCRQNLVLGVGCERGCDVSELDDLLANMDLDPRSIACVASIDLKVDEAAIHQLADRLQVPARFFSAEELEVEAPRLANPSEVVFAEVGCHGVAEGAALAAVGQDGELKVAKQKSKRATMAVGSSENPILADQLGRPRGHLSVVGIGPGSEGWRSPEVTQLVWQATDLVGYSLYLDLLGDLVGDRQRHDFDLGKEEDRVRHAMELAGEGKNVALVCSGDAGIYAMATLVYELLDTGGLSDAAQRIAIQVSPGISALQAAAARAGAPLGHDFCTISLSDLLTPWESIQMRVNAAAQGDFVIAFYNPVSKRRRTQLAYAKDVLLEHRPADTPVILATNLGRDGELIRVVPLAELNIDDVDMLTVVIVGSSQSQTVATGDGKTWVYTPRGYAAKEGTLIGRSA
ncbi:MAG: precorrin-3B C(17)-methyltransferase, partial [Rhizobiaceae bacterium]|nr:precorrin-3B C(17)-methyltransferase [Hyphomicrobiales bacterium]NRB31003.1 precorrin-3B C(17)-methyltransferase [Rhizobiaceae bacterium]